MIISNKVNRSHPRTETLLLISKTTISIKLLKMFRITAALFKTLIIITVAATITIVYS